MTKAITSTRLRELYGAPSPRAAAKEIDSFDHHCRQFIEHSTFLVLATSDGSQLDVSPKGDAPGFVTVEDDQHLLIPDRPGNNRLDGMLNILKHPQVALIFFIPTVTETLRVNGTATIIEDTDVCERFKVRDRAPITVLRIKADEIFTHCGKAPLRGGLWKPQSWPSSRPVPTLNEMIRDHTQMDTASIEQSAVDRMYEETLY